MFWSMRRTEPARFTIRRRRSLSDSWLGQGWYIYCGPSRWVIYGLSPIRRCWALLAPEVAVENIEQFTSRPHVRQVGEANGFWPVYRRVADPVKPRGNLVPDAHLVALMRHHGIATIWSHDRDFRKFEGIRIRDPFSG